VDVKGSVKKPGLYTFARQQRVADAIDKAGGALPNAELAEINLAQLLTDGSILRIPAKGEMLKAASPCTQGGQPYLAPGNGSSAEKANPSPSSTGTGEGKININTASLQELMNLPGIGETRAKAILAYREKNGQFRSL
ncbi:ComEA family DNA-binding protein, partial [Microbacteriaceae bacterium K1510]|nr:ComEA family DNA-binding protein [Microbacteriaceae bacterium K1510]